MVSLISQSTIAELRKEICPCLFRVSTVSVSPISGGKSKFLQREEVLSNVLDKNLCLAL